MMCLRALELSLIAAVAPGLLHAQELPTESWRIQSGDISANGQVVQLPNFPYAHRDGGLAFWHYAPVIQESHVIVNDQLVFQNPGPLPGLPGVTTGLNGPTFGCMTASGMPWWTIPVEHPGQVYADAVYYGTAPIAYYGKSVDCPDLPSNTTYLNQQGVSRRSSSCVVRAFVLSPGTLGLSQVLLDVRIDASGQVTSTDLIARVGAPFSGVVGNVTDLGCYAVSESGHTTSILSSAGSGPGDNRSTFLVDGVPVLTSQDISPVDGKAWESLRSCQVDESGRWALVGTIEGGEWIILNNGELVVRESEAPAELDGIPFNQAGPIGFAATGKLVWTVQVIETSGQARSGLFLEDRPIGLADFSVLDGQTALAFLASDCSVDTLGLEIGVLTQYQAADRTRFIAAILPLDQAIGLCEADPSSLGNTPRLGAYGSPYVQHGEDIELLTNRLPAGTLALHLASTQTGQVILPSPGQGTLCLGGTVWRSAVRPTSEFGALRTRLSEFPVPVVPVSGQALYFQTWYRDTAPSGHALSRVSEAVSMSFL